MEIRPEVEPATNADPRPTEITWQIPELDDRIGWHRNLSSAFLCAFERIWGELSMAATRSGCGPSERTWRQPRLTMTRLHPFLK